MANTKEIKAVTNIPFLPLEEDAGESRHGAQFFRNVKQLQVGFGSEVFRVDRDGMWAGAEDFASAPWSVDWQGNMVANSITLSGYIPTGGALTDIGAGNITSTYIGSGAITTGKIAANAVTASQIAAGSVTATKINVSQLSAISANIGSITAGTLTGVVLQTDTSGERIVIDGVDNDISIYDAGGDLRARGYQQGWEFYNESGTLVGELYASNSEGFLIAGDLFSSGSVYYGAGVSGAHSFHIGTSGSTLRLFIDTDDIFIGDTNNLDMDIEMLGLVEFHNERAFITPTVGRVSSLGTLFGGGVGWSANRDSTGVYTVTHNLGSSSYSVVACVEESSGIYDIKIGSRGSNSFTVRINDGDAAGSNSLTNADFNFMLFYY